MTNEQKNKQLAREFENSEQLVFDLASQVELLFTGGATDATEQVLNSNTGFPADDELIMSLLYAEIMAADRISQSLSAETLIARFPALSERISRLVAIHETLKPASVPAQPEPSNTSQSDNETDFPVFFHETKRDQESPHPTRSSQPHRFEIDQFEVLEKVGQGGMGVVYRAREKDLNRMVALKVLRSPLTNTNDRQRLMNEAQAAARLRHPGIVQIHHVGETADQPYLCFEFIDGSHLGDRLAGSTMLPREACVLLNKVANAISFAHQQGIIHRDLKPANILIDSTGDPKVADFGLAKFLESSEQQQCANRLTQTGSILGSICYMAPEQLTGDSKDVDCRADIYGLGTILYEMLGGRPPLIGDSPAETMYLVRTTEPTSLRKLNSKVPRDVETICLKCLEKQPEQRFQTVAALEQELQRYLNGEPLTIRPISSITVANRWCRRRPAIAILSGLTAMMLIALTIGGYLMAWNQQQHTLLLKKQRDLAEKSANLALEKAEEADKATQFMIKTLGSAHPNRDGRNVTVAERLADGLQELNESYPDGSAGKAALLRTIGKTYEGLGLFQLAHDPLKTAWQLYAQLNGHKSQEALETENEYGDLLTKLGRYEEAETRLQHASAGLVVLLGPDSEPAITAENNLAHNLFDQGDRPRALQMFADNYARARASLSPHNPTTIVALLAYANALKSAGRFAESRELVDPVLPIAEEAFGASHLLVISLKSASAGIDRANGKYALALEKYLDIHELLAHKLGEEHMRTINSLGKVAIVHADMGDHDQAREFTNLIRTRLARVLGENHPQTFRSILNVALLLEESDRRNEARELYRETFEQASKMLGAGHLETMMLATFYGRSLAENNQLVEAERLLTDAMNCFRDAELIDPAIRAESFTCLGALYRRTDRNEQAVAMYQAALEIAQDAFGELNPNTLSTKNNLAGAYHALDQMDDAIQLYDEVLDGLRQMLGNEHPNTLVTGLNIAITYRDIDRSDKAAEILSDIVPVFGRKLPGTWLAHTAQFQLGRAFLDIDSVALAKLNLDAAFAGFEKLIAQQPASKTIGLANQLRRIIEQFESQGETIAAETWRQRRSRLLEAQGLSTDDD